MRKRGRFYMKDLRLTKLADVLVNHSCKVKKGEKVMIEAFGIPSELVKEVVNKVYDAGGYPFVYLRDYSVLRSTIGRANEEYCKLWAKYDGFAMDDMDCYIGIRGGDNSCEMGDIPAEQNGYYERVYSYPVHHKKRVCNTRWVVLRYPTPSMAQMSGKSTEAFEDFYFDVCTMDYDKMDNAMDALKSLMDKTDKVRLVAPGTDLSFSIKGLPALKCAGECNIPDGEVYTAPVKNSVNGVITYNAPSMQQGLKHENVRLVFNDGKIVEATSNYTEQINKIFDTDDGARYVGEFAIGVNPYINHPMGDILFDEKIAGSIHFTPGCCYDDCDNGNRSGIHWDLVLVMTKEYGGGEIYFDGKLIRKDGLFVLPELEALNPENLK